MKNNKMNKVYEVINGNKRGLNLHEIKAITGIGNGYKDTTMNATPVVTINEGEKINRVATNKKRRVNLHKIKAQTGAGNGHKNSNIVDLINNISNIKIIKTVFFFSIIKSTSYHLILLYYIFVIYIIFLCYF